LRSVRDPLTAPPPVETPIRQAFAEKTSMEEPLPGGGHRAGRHAKRSNRPLASIVAQIGERALDQQLEDWLNEIYPANGPTFRNLCLLTEEGAREGWLCQREADGIRFGRAIKPGGVVGCFSVRMD
jgi:hypothetical protein